MANGPITQESVMSRDDCLAAMADGRRNYTLATLFSSFFVHLPLPSDSHLWT